MAAAVREASRERPDGGRVLQAGRGKAGRWKYWQRQVERLTTSEPRRAASLAVFLAVEVIPRRTVVVRFPGRTTLEIADDRIDLVRLQIDRMAVLPEADAC